MSLSFSPILPWAALGVVAVAVVGLTLWAYLRHMKGGAGRWRWVALVLRMAAVLLLLLGATRPAAVLMKKVKQTASVVFLIDASESMGISDAVGGKSRWEVARKAMTAAMADLKKRAPGLDLKGYEFDSGLRDAKAGETTPPNGKSTALGTALDEALKRQNGVRMAAVVVIADGASNTGPSPLAVAGRFKNLQVPVSTVALGTAGAGNASRDLAMRTIDAGPTVFVKNELEVKGTVGVRGYPGQEVEVELYVEPGAKPIDTRKIRVPEGKELVSIAGLKYTPKTPGEKKVTLRVKPKEGELVPGNNEISTFVTVLSGGINVLYVQGPNFSWEPRYLTPALDAADFIQTDYKVLREPAQDERGDLDDVDLAPGRYDVYILGDVPAECLTKAQRRLLATAVQRGAGLMMLGGRSSFGEGGWAGTPVADVLPVEVRPGEGQIEPEGGLKLIPNAQGLDSFLLQLGPTRRESLRLWDALPPISGANRLGRPKLGAVLLALSPSGEPLMVDSEVGNKGRSLAFAGETWVWARAFEEEVRQAHRKFWRQAILWLAHKEHEGKGQVKLQLERRRVASGQKVEIIASARSTKGEPIPDAKLEAKVEFLGPGGKSLPAPLYNQGADARGAFYETAKPGDYRVTITGSRAGQDLGRDAARFSVYEDDRELSNPAADPALLKQIAAVTGGQALVPEQLGKYLRTLDDEKFTSFERQQEYRLWDNWPFLLLFTALLSAEWWLRKRKGWV